LLDIQKLIGRKIDVIDEHPYSITVDENIKAPKQTKQKRVFTEKRPAVANRKRDIRRAKNMRTAKI
jgi:hypothetical protein